MSGLIVCATQRSGSTGLADQPRQYLAGIADRSVEVFVHTPIAAGRLTGMTGENAPYEPPEAAEIVIRDEPVEASARRLLEAIS